MAELAGSGRTHTFAWESAVATAQAHFDAVLFDDRPRVQLPHINIDGREFAMSFDRHPLPRFGDLPAVSEPVLTLRARVASAVPSLIVLGIWMLISVATAQLLSERMLKA